MNNPTQEPERHGMVKQYFLYRFHKSDFLTVLLLSQTVIGTHAACARELSAGDIPEATGSPL